MRTKRLGQLGARIDVECTEQGLSCAEDCTCRDAAGSQGPAGPAGATGATGAQGPKGDKGDKGDTGDAGPQGPQGATGATGSQGPQGATGATGSAGSTGAQGPQGQAGANGLNAPVYSALANGTTAIPFATANVCKLTATATASLTATVPAAGSRVVLMILTSGTTSYTLTFGTGFKPTATLATGTTSARLFCVEFTSDGTNLYETGRTAAMVA